MFKQDLTIMDDGEGHLYIGHAGFGMSILSLANNTVKNYMNSPWKSNSIMEMMYDASIRIHMAIYG